MPNVSKYKSLLSILLLFVNRLKAEIPRYRNIKSFRR